MTPGGGRPDIVVTATAAAMRAALDATPVATNLIVRAAARAVSVGAAARAAANFVAPAARGGVPAIYNHREFVEAGGLMSCGPGIRDAYAWAAVLADRMLEGVNPANMPVEPPVRSAPAIDVATIGALGTTVPQGLPLRVDTVIPWGMDGVMRRLETLDFARAFAARPVP